MRATPVILAAIATAAAAAAAPAPAAALPPPVFRTPDGMTGCAMRASSVRCDVVRHTYRPPRRPTSCRARWGGAIVVGARGRARFICHRATVIPRPGPGRTVRHGTSVYRNGFRCTVARAGVTCVNPQGRGFLISPGRYRRF